MTRNKEELIYADSNASQNSTVNESLDADTRYSNNSTDNDQTYPPILESAPFPALASINEIADTITRVKSNQSTNLDIKENINQDEKKAEIFKQEPYHTEGIRNPGWLSVLANFLVNFFVFGTTFSWGNFQTVYLNEVYAGQTNLLKISFVGTSANAIMLGMGIFITPVIQRIGFRSTIMIGTIGAPLSLILASFATQLWHIYLSQGILIGITSSFAFAASVTLPAQWFTKKRALATGIAASGSGVGGVCIAPMTQSLIKNIGYRNALRVLGAFGFAILAIATALAFSRYRPPPVSNSKLNKWYNSFFDKSLLSTRFIILLAFCFFVPFGYIAPFFLAPQYVRSIGLDAAAGAAMISTMSAANAVCRICLGYLADKIGRFNTLFLCTFLAGFFTMVIWQFSTNYTTFAIYCVLYGLTAGGFVSLLPVSIADIVGVENIQRGLGMGYMTSVVGSLLGTPLIGLLFNAYGWTPSIQFAGCLGVFSSLFVLILRFMMSRKLFIKI